VVGGDRTIAIRIRGDAGDAVVEVGGLHRRPPIVSLAQSPTGASRQILTCLRRGNGWQGGTDPLTNQRGGLPSPHTYDDVLQDTWPDDSLRDLGLDAIGDRGEDHLLFWRVGVEEGQS